MKITNSKDLTENEKEIFTKIFYDIEDLGIDDLETPLPWGCPWYFGSIIYLKGDCIKEMAENYFQEYKEQIESLLKENDNQ